MADTTPASEQRQCPMCSTSNQISYAYCHGCGYPLKPDNQLKAQVLSIVHENFKDQDLVAEALSYRIIVNAESRLNDWLKILGAIAATGGAVLTILFISLGVWGFRSVTEAKQQIAITTDTEKKQISEMGEQEKSILENTSEGELGKLKQEATPTEQAFATFRSHVSSQEQNLQNQAANYQARLKAVSNIQDLSPSIPIGQIGGNLLSPSSSLPLLANNSVDTSSTIAKQPYRIGSFGLDVYSIQSRLLGLGCYSGALNGNYDQATADAVEKFKTAQQTATSNSQSTNLSPELVIFSAGEGPAADDPSEPGVVDKSVWLALGNPSATSCN